MLGSCLEMKRGKRVGVLRVKGEEEEGGCGKISCLRM